MSSWRRKRVGRFLPVFCLVALPALLLLPAGATGGEITGGEPDTADLAASILRGRQCPCGCGSYLPGSTRTPACFGCSVGKAEISRVLEALRAGKSSVDITTELSKTVLIDVFGDYSDPDLPEVWQRAVRVAGEFHQRRVVLRTPGRTEDARRAIRLAECARAGQQFSRVQQALIDHRGPWDQETLIALAQDKGLNPDKVRECLVQTDISAQIAKDREHAKRFGVQNLPAISVNQQPTAPTAEAIRRAIWKAIKDESI